MRAFKSAFGLLLVTILLEISAFALLSFRSDTFDVMALAVCGLMVFILLFQYMIFTRFFRHIDRYLLIIPNILIAVGVIMQYRLDSEMALKQIAWIAIGMVAMAVAITIVKYMRSLRKPALLYCILALLMLASSLLLGRVVGGAQNWFKVGPMTVQPSEFVKILLILIMAGLLTRTNKARPYLLLYGFICSAVVLLLLQKDLGAALLYVVSFIIVFYIATSKKLLTLLHMISTAGASVAAYHLFSHIRVRVAIWRNPWISYENQGYQIVQGLMAIASGGFFGLGLGNGIPKVIPAYHTDFIFAAICEEFGILFGVVLVAFYVLFLIRGALIALGCTDKFYALLAVGCTTMLTLQSFVILGGVIKLIPLTGVTLPFISYGGSSMLTSMIMVGILEAIAILNGEREEAAMGGDSVEQISED